MAVRIPRLSPLTLPLLLALAGCGPALPDEAGAELGTRAADIRIANSLSTQALVLNAISTNPTANGMLATTPLIPLFDPVSGNAYVRQQLHDPNARKFMEYLVSCALNRTNALPWFNPASSTPSLWHGQAGLCNEWATQVPTQECLHRVSACILARNNALGRRVELSLRGEHSAQPAVFSLEPVTRAAEHDPDTTQWLSSFQGCGSTTQGVQRDCGWKVDAIGRCQPGATVSVGAGGSLTCPGSALGASVGARMVLRVCDGIVGCDRFGPRFRAEADGSCAGTAPVASFTCPAEGYFNVMTAPWDSSTSGTASVAVTSASPVAYGLSEKQVFSVREGAFYGNLFDPAALATTVEVRAVRAGEKERYEVVGADVEVQGSIYRRMYSCYDPAWASGTAYATNRVCALPSSGSNCAATVTGPCWSTSTPEAARCATQDGPMVPGDGDFEACKDTGGNVWMEPVTVFLHDACGPVDSEGDPRVCSRQSREGKVY